MSLSPTGFPKFQAIGPNGPLSGYLVYTYITGTTTPAETWQDLAGTTPNSNPITLDSDGQAVIFLTQNQNYKFVIVNPQTSATFETIDPVIPAYNPTSGTFTLTGNLQIGQYSIVDGNGNDYIAFVQATGAVNAIQISNAATTVAPIIQAIGTDTNIDLVAEGKGTGALSTPAIKIDGVKITGSATTGNVLTATSSTAAGWAAPTVISGITVSGTPAAGNVLTATSTSAADWAAPTVIGGITVSGTPSTGEVLTATSSSAADWQPASTSTVPNQGTNKNHLMNGGFQIWQTGTSFTINSNSSSAIQLCDRWMGQVTSDSHNNTITFQQTSDNSGRYYMRVKCTTYNASTTKVRLVFTMTRAEYLAMCEMGRTGAGNASYQSGTLSMYVRANTSSNATMLTSTSNVGLYSGTSDTALYGSGGTLNTSWSLSGAMGFSSPTLTTSWQRIYSAQAIGATPDSSTNAAFFIDFNFNTLNDYIDISDVMLEMVGDNMTAPSAYSEESPELTLDRCRAFYRKSFAVGTTPAQNLGTGTGEYIFTASVASTNTNRSPTITFDTPMRSTPGITLYSPAASTAQVYDETAAAACTSSGQVNASTTGFYISCTANSSTAVGNALGVHWAADARLA